MSPEDPTPAFPLGLLVLLLATAGVGAFLLLAGNRLLLASLGLIGGIGGAIAGWIAFEILIPGAPAWVGAVAVGTVGAILMALSARLIIAVMLAAILGMAGWLTVASAERHGFIDVEPDDAVVIAAADTTSEDFDDRDLTVRDQIGERLTRMAISFRAPQLERHLYAMTSFIGAAIDSARRQWTDTPPALRTLMLASAGMCAFFGLCLGLVAPRFTAGGITAAIGATLLVLCAAVAIQQFGGVGDEGTDPIAAIPGDRTVWLGGWAFLTIAGTMVQTMRKPRPAPKPAEG